MKNIIEINNMSKIYRLFDSNKDKYLDMFFNMNRVKKPFAE